MKYDLKTLEQVFALLNQREEFIELNKLYSTDIKKLNLQLELFNDAIKKLLDL